MTETKYLEHMKQSLHEPIGLRCITNGKMGKGH